MITEQQFEQFKIEIEKKIKNRRVIDHIHNGFDSNKVSFSDIINKKIYISHTIYGADAATAANYGTIFISPFVCYVSKFQEVHRVAGTNAGAVSLTLEKLTGTTAPDSGSLVLSAVLSLKATANTVQSGVMTTTLANRNLAIGDRLCLKDAGTLTDVSNVTVLIELTLV